MNQTSPESTSIYDFLMAMHHYLNHPADWSGLANIASLNLGEAQAFEDYASCFLSNVGNYYGTGDQKFTPELDRTKLVKLFSALGSQSGTRTKTVNAMLACPPYNLGLPSKTAQSAYYGDEALSEPEEKAVIQAMHTHNILPENTRLR